MPTEKQIILGLLNCLSNAKAQNIIRYQVSEIVSYADEVIIATGMSGSHVKSLVAKVEDYYRDINLKAYSEIRKRENYDWIVLDYHYMIIHLFQEATRAYYDLDSFFQKNLLPKHWEVYES